MKAVTLTRYLLADNPDAFADTSLDRTGPTGRDLLVEVKAVSVNPVDTKVRIAIALYEATRRAGPMSLGATLGATVVSALLHAPTVMLCLLFLAADPVQLERWMALALLAAGYAAAAVCAVAGARRAGLKPRPTDILTMPAYWPLQTLAAVRALWELRSNPYFWAKTEHGHSPAPETEQRTKAECPSPSPSFSSPPSPRDLAFRSGGRANLPTSRAGRG